MTNLKRKFIIDKYDLLKEIKFLLKYKYIATFTEDGEALKLSFDDGTTFYITVEEKTSSY